MEILWMLVAAVAVLGPWVLGVVALVRASRALAEVRRASAAAEVAWRAARPAAAGARTAVPAPLAAEPSAEAAPPETALAAHGMPAAPPAPAGDAAPPAAPGDAAPPAPPAPPAWAAVAGLEEKIALGWFTRAGALAILLGAAYFLKYAIDNAWIGAWGRIALACVAGGVALALGEWLRPRTRPPWIHALQGAGLALLFLAAFGAHALYALVPAGAAFAGVAAVALLGGALAVRHRAELLLGLALAGGLLAPVVLSTGEDRPAALFGYLLALDLLALAVSVRERFLVVPWLAYAGTALVAAGWYDRFFETWPPPAVEASFPADGRMGRYFPLARRAVPLGAAAAFAAAWLAAHGRLRRAAPRPWSDAWLAAALLFAIVAPFALLHDRALLAGAALSASALLAAVLLPAAGRPGLVLAAEAIAFGLLWIAVDDGPGASARWIAAAGLVGAAHLGAVAHALLVRGEAATLPRAAAAAGAGLGFAAFAVALTGPDDGVVRGALVGGAGAAELALGAAVLSRSRAKGSVLLGASLALLAGAVAFLFSGATVTVAWAAMGAVAAVLGARERERPWVGGGCALLAAALLRALAVDVPSVSRATWRFVSTAGAEGRLEPAFLLNPRAIALAALAAALLVSARAVSRGLPGGGPAAAVLAALGWAAAVGLAVGEARDLVRVLPLPPARGDVDAFLAYEAALQRAGWEQGGALSMATSLVVAIAATLLVAGGFASRDAFHRWLGLGTFGLVLAKLVFSDVWLLSRLQQVAVFLAVGVLLLGAAFLYARHGARLAALLKDAPPRGGGGAAFLLLASLAAPAEALDQSRFATLRTVDGVAGPGLHAVEADADLLRASRAAAGTLADVRIAGPDGAEVPWALRPPAEAAEPVVSGALVDPVVLRDGSVRAVVDLGPSPPRHGELHLDLDGEEFLRPVRLEASADGRTYGVLAEGGRVWAIRDEPEARRTSLRHPPSEARFLRVTLLAGAGDPPRLTGARAAAGDAPPPELRALAVAATPRRSTDGRETILDLDLAAPGLPVEAVEIDAATDAFERRVRVLASADGAHWVPAGAGAVWRTGSAAAGASEELRVPARTGGRRFVRLLIADGDSPPLAIAAVRVRWRPRHLVFRAARAGDHLLLAGADVPAAAYDLGALLARSGDAGAAPARLGPPGPNPRFREPGRELPFTERYRVPLSAGLAILFGALALWAARLLRRPPGGAITS